MLSYKFIWTVLATIGVITQFQPMIESYNFNGCYNRILGIKVKNPKTIDKTLHNIYKYQAVRYCNGGDSSAIF